jgi:HJR/Mrr/RecB family endonuclease
MKRNLLDYDRWKEIESGFRQLAIEWAAHELDVARKLFPRHIVRYTTLLEAASISSDAFKKELLKTIWIDKAPEIAEELKEVSSHFRTPEALIKYATNVTRSTLRHGPKALRRSEDIHQYESAIDEFWPKGQSLVIDHAMYALYSAWQPESLIVVPDDRARLLRAMAVDESLLRLVSPRRFEELVAYLYECLGCKVELTAASRDFGADILAWHGGPLGSQSMIAIQVKRYAQQHRVGLKALFELHGAVAHYGADSGHIVTSSDFTKPARIFADAQRLHLVNLQKFQEELGRLFQSN